MKRFALLVLALSVTFAAGAQETYPYAERDTCTLYLDIHVVKWFRKLNEEGYPVVAIDYRLGMKGFKVKKTLGGAQKAIDRFVMSQRIGVEDVFSAVSFLAAHPELGIPSDNIVISGSSAGAIISLASAYNIANGNTEGLPQGFNFKGVMSFAGGIISNHGKIKFSQAPCPILLFHGMDDTLVAYRHHGILGLELWGSDYIAEMLMKKGWNCSIWRFKNRAHDVAGYTDCLWPIEKEFLEKNVIQGIPCTVDAVVDDPSLPLWKAWGRLSVDNVYREH